MKKRRYIGSCTLFLAEVIASYAQKASISCLHFSLPAAFDYPLSYKVIQLFKNGILMKNRYTELVAYGSDRANVLLKRRSSYLYPDKRISSQNQISISFSI